MNETLPEKFLLRLHELYSPQKLEQFLLAFHGKQFPSFRINTLKAEKQAVVDVLTKDGFQIKQVVWYPDAFVLENKSIRELTETDTYKNGFIYIQNLSSMVPALALAPQPGETILDMCASPGSKTTQIACLMQNSGEITANDISYKRLFKLKGNLKTNGVTNVQVLNVPGESLWKKLPEYFDKTLVDAACSMEGRIRFDDPKTYQDWSYKKIKQLAKLQKYLLRSAVSLTKVGGTIVYSTCTLSPEENEEVIQWVVDKNPGALLVETIEINGLKLDSALSAWKKKTFPDAKNAARVAPSEHMEGFFVAKIKKVATTLPTSELARFSRLH